MQTLPAPYAEGRYVAPFSPTVHKGAARTVDPRLYLSILKRHFKLFALVFCAVLLGVGLFTLMQPRRYTATTEILLDPRKEHVASTEEVLSSLPAESNVVDTEVEVVTSPELARRVVTTLHLDRDPEFAAVRQADDRKRLERTVEAVSKGLSVRRAGLTYVIKLSFMSTDPNKAALIANKFSELYVTQQVEAKQGATAAASTWLASRLADLRKQVLGDEQAVQQYKIDNNLQSAAGTNLTEQEIAAYNQSLSAALVQVAEDRARLETARSQLAAGSKGDDVGEALASKVIQELRTQRATLSEKVTVLQHDFKPGYPPLDRAKEELADVDEQIQQEIKRTITNLDAKLRVSERRASAIDANLSGAKGALTSNTRASVRLNELERTAQASKTLYESYLSRYKETSSQQGLAQADARIASWAEPPTRMSSPKLFVMGFVGIMLALAAGTGAIALAEYLRSGLQTSDDVAQGLQAQPLGAIPELKSVARGARSAVDHVVDKRLSAFPESFRSLRASVLGIDPGRIRTVAVTSALPREGKSTTAICLARTAALQGWRVLLIDSDLRRPTVSGMFEGSPKLGLLDVLFGRCRLGDAVVRDPDSGTDLLLLIKTQETEQDVFGTPAFSALLAEAKAGYDLVILDTAPVLPIADTRVLAQKVDGVLCVARWKKTPRRAVGQALHILESLHANVLGVVLTRVDMAAQASTGYGEPEYFYKYYKDYYAS